MTMAEFPTQLDQLLNSHDEPETIAVSLHDFLIRSLANGRRKEVLYGQLLAMRGTLPPERESILLDAIDALARFCSARPDDPTVNEN
jgi:hypothetical protein